MKRNKAVIAAFILPALLIFCVVFVYPIVRTVFMSFFSVENATSTVDQWRFVGTRNYFDLANTELFKISLWNLFRIWAFGGLSVLSLSLLFAVILNSGIRFKKFFRAVIYMPNVISAVALATMWIQYVYNPKFGLATKAYVTVTGWLEAVGLGSFAKINWTDSDHKFWSLLIAYCFGMVGYHMLIFSSGIEKIPGELYEAATIDGASRPQQFAKVTYPLLQGVIKTNITMWSITSVGFFVWAQLFSMVTADTQTITPMVYMYLQVFGAGNVVTERNAGLGAAVGVILSLIVVAVFILTTVLIRDDEIEF